MTRSVTLAGYGLLVGAIIALQVVAMVTRRVPTIGTIVGMATRTPPGRCAFILGWLWLGWHVFVRAHH